jgi:hypothetical protein
MVTNKPEVSITQITMTMDEVQDKKTPKLNILG